MEIGPKPFIIAELSGNHNGSLDTALAMIAAAKECGCDAVKIQTYEPEDLCDPAHNEIYEKCKIPRDWLPKLFECAKQTGISLFSSVFATWAVDFLRQFDCPTYKLASPESTRLPTVRYIELVLAIRRTGRPLIASSGSLDMSRILAFEPDHTLYCVQGYPAKIEERHLQTAARLSGLSDHSADILTPLAAIWHGARIIEKHFKLDDNCIDAAFSLNPHQMKLLCDIAHG